MNSHSISGFLLFHYLHIIPEYFKKLFKLFQDGNLKILLNIGEESSAGPFEGVHSVEVSSVLFVIFIYKYSITNKYLFKHLLSGKNVGKVVVKIQ